MKSFLVKAFALNFVKKLNSFMTEVLSYRNQSNDLKSKSMEWFLYDRHSLMKELRSLKNPIKGKRITNYVLLWNFCLSFTIWLEISFWQKCWYQHNWRGVTHNLYVFWTFCRTKRKIYHSSAEFNVLGNIDSTDVFRTKPNI